MKSKSSYKEIAKSTGIFGGSQLINVLLGVVRSKLTAIFLGPVGVGIFGTLQSIIDLNRSLSGLGLDTGAVKELATIKPRKKDAQQETIYVINSWYLFSAILGASICFIFAKQLSIWAFDNEEFSLHIMGLSVAVFFIALTAGLTAVLQGLRKIAPLALASTVSSIVSLIVLIPVYYRWGIDGILPMFILSSIITFSISFIFYRRLEIIPIKTSLKDIVKKGSRMLELGLFVLIGGIISSVCLLAVRAYIVRLDGLDAVGLFHTAWVINTLFWGIVLRSSNTDFFPKLCSIVDYKKEANKFVNEQTHFTLLIIAPCIIGLVIFSRFVIQLLFTVDFISAASTLQWHLIGAFFKIASTPMASIMLAKNRGGIHLICEIIFWASYLILGYFLYPTMGIEALGIAYLVSYLIYTPTILIAGSWLNNARWGGLVVRTVFVNSFLFVIFSLTIYFLPDYYYIVGGAMILSSALFSWKHLRRIFDPNQLIQWLKKHLYR